MKALITQIKFDREVETKFGKRYRFSVHYDNKIGSFLSKTPEQTDFVQGEENEFTETENYHGGNTYYNIRPIKKSGSSQFSRKLKQEQARYSGFAMSYAKDLVVSGMIKPDQMYSEAEKMYDWMVTKDKELQNGK